MEAKWKGLSVAVVVAIAFVFALSGLASAAGSGYNQSYTQSAGHASVAAVDLTSVSSSYSGGPTIAVSFTVSGQIMWQTDGYGYLVYFGGTAESNATAYAVFSNGTAGFVAPAGHPEGGLLTPTVNGGTLSFNMNVTDVGPASSYAIDVLAVEYTSSTTGTYSWLGTHYSAGGTCTSSTSCTTSSGSSSFDWWIVIIPVVVVAVVVIVLLLMMQKKGPTQPAMMGQPGQPMGQPGQPDAGTAAAQGQPNWQTPPPPPGAQ